jgi:hypothetical protein
MPPSLHLATANAIGFSNITLNQCRRFLESPPENKINAVGWVEQRGTQRQINVGFRMAAPNRRSVFVKRKANEFIT